jgi:hypothetical protein
MQPTTRPVPRVFAGDFIRSCVAWGGPLFRRASAREGEDRADALLGELLPELEARVAADPNRHRWDSLEALAVCRKRD